jgi:hypothetical protein
MVVLVEIMGIILVMVVRVEIKEGEAGRARPWLGLGCW